MPQIKQIKSDFIKVLAHSQNLPINRINVDKLFEDWARNKKDFIEAIGPDLIYKFGTVTSYVPEDRMRDLREIFLNRLNNFLPYQIVDNIDVFLSSQSPKAFCENSMDHETKVGNKKLAVGHKITRALKYFISNEKELDCAQTEYSRVIQEYKVTGTLCISVHPLDYLALSETPHSWRSCHALDGEYRAGNLNYMADSSTLVCYLESEGAKFQLPRFPADVPWSGKKWRCLLFVSQNRDMVFAGKQYPMTLSSGLQWLELLMENTLRKNGHYKYWTNWKNDKIVEYTFEDGEVSYLRQPYYPVLSRIIPQSSLIHDGEYTYHFNDLKYSSDYTKPWFMVQRYTDPMGLKFFIGEKFNCITCGRTHNHSSDSLLCLDCDEELGTEESEEFGICPHCGARMHRRDFVYVEPTRSYMCSACAVANYERCQDCGVYHNPDDLTEVNGKRICTSCARYTSDINDLPFQEGIYGTWRLSED